MPSQPPQPPTPPRPPAPLVPFDFAPGHGPKVVEFPRLNLQPHEIDIDQIQNDLGRTRLFAKWHQGSAYISDNSWYVWDESSKRWLDESQGGGAFAFGLMAQNFLMRLAEIAENMRLPSLRSGSDGLLSARAIRNIITLAKIQPEFQVQGRAFDADPYLLGVANGVVDLRTGKLLENQRDFHVSMHSPVAFTGLSTKSELLEKFLRGVTGNDREYILFLREYFGYMMTGSNELERFTILKGEGGTGKSTLVGAIRSVLGPYAGTADHDSFSRRQAGSIREDLASFSKKRLITDMELPDGQLLDTAMVKLLSGRDEIRARKLYKEGQYITPTWSIVVGCNSWPRLSSAPDSGWWRRILVLPFDNLPKNIDTGLKEKLHYPENQRAILSWLVAGSRDYYRNRKPGREWKVPPKIRAAGNIYRVHMDHGDYWVRQCLEFGDKFVTPSADLYESYLEFCQEHHVAEHQQLGPKWVARRLLASHCEQARDKRRRYQVGVRIKPKAAISNLALGDGEDDGYLISPLDVAD